ncbi:aminotransferase class I/II-fold pyridoxal phosphate-dependent enzyme [Nereida sp. MMG025]|uniref:aminotransferase class I/II-fold pyridoxal phosphate-dependent enzyme n=1 Tax=Nereida sp. MMG025 TaxID=2909981 RepID=UPI00272E3727|nr:aminotransferase class I/II-fold pyridoxal phosphate-dependent enzyme [Nereida sp. MMG025]
MRIWLSKPHMSGTEQAYIAQAFESNFIAPLGPQLNAFEDCVATYLGGDVGCVGLSSGSAALHLALRLAGVEAGDDVWVCSMTFAGGVFPVLYQNARPVFIDLSADSWTICVETLEAHLKAANDTNTLPKALVPTDLYGQSVEMEPIERLCAQYGVKLIVDSAESLGARDASGRACGTGGDAAILSFNGNKIITTGGGGMLVSRDHEMLEEARKLSTQARDPAPHYEHSTYGYNYRLGNVPAAIGLGQMEVLDERVTARRAVFDRYVGAFAGQAGVTFMPEPDGAYSSHWLTAVSFDPNACGRSREDIRQMLMEHKIEARPLWKPMHMQPVFEGTLYYGQGVDEGLFETGLCLPSGSDMTVTEQGEVIDRIAEFLKAA